jgi:hypothetical protein
MAKVKIGVALFLGSSENLKCEAARVVIIISILTVKLGIKHRALIVLSGWRSVTLGNALPTFGSATPGD